ncbi:hypothetical protein TSMEX_002817 [Taenia solium]|eukprot:TsM_000202400 transcript=TsM_000202400 gene=TsM_000202400
MRQQDLLLLMVWTMRQADGANGEDRETTERTTECSRFGHVDRCNMSKLLVAFSINETRLALFDCISLECSYFLSTLVYC